MMTFDWYMYPLIIFAGATAGVINTLAGNGSAITLSLLLFLGLPADVANGTNRVGILAQSISAISTFRNRGLSGLLSKSRFILIPAVIGAIIGALVAVEVNKEVLEKVIGAIMVVMLFVVLAKPKRWLQETATAHSGSPWIMGLIFFAVGFYGGFIQMGFGIFFLAAGVLVARYSLIDSNIIKLVVVFLYALPVLLIFVWSGDVAWVPGLLLAVGQAFGGWLAARFALEHPQAKIWIRRLLIVMILAVIVKLFELLRYMEIFYNYIF